MKALKPESLTEACQDVVKNATPGGLIDMLLGSDEDADIGLAAGGAEVDEGVEAQGEARQHQENEKDDECTTEGSTEGSTEGDGGGGEAAPKEMHGKQNEIDEDLAAEDAEVERLLRGEGDSESQQEVGGYTNGTRPDGPEADIPGEHEDISSLTVQELKDRLMAMCVDVGNVSEKHELITLLKRTFRFEASSADGNRAAANSGRADGTLAKKPSVPAASSTETPAAPKYSEPGLPWGVHGHAPKGPPPVGQPWPPPPYGAPYHHGAWGPPAWGPYRPPPPAFFPPAGGAPPWGPYAPGYGPMPYGAPPQHRPPPSYGAPPPPPPPDEAAARGGEVVDRHRSREDRSRSRSGRPKRRKRTGRRREGGAEAGEEDRRHASGGRRSAPEPSPPSSASPVDSPGGVWTSRAEPAQPAAARFGGAESNGGVWGSPGQGSGDDESLRSWLFDLDSGRGALERYLEPLCRKYGSLDALRATLLPEPISPSVVGRVDPSLWEALGVASLGHRLLLSKGIVALAER